jgi:hypothetical protein
MYVRVADLRTELISHEDMSPYLAIPGGALADQNKMEGIPAPAGSLYSPMLITSSAGVALPSNDVHYSSRVVHAL